MKYLLLVCRDPEFKTDPAVIVPTLEAWDADISGRGVKVHGHHLAAPSTSVTVRVRGDEVLVTDGPFAETKEHIAGFDIMECASMEAAVEEARNHPLARFGAIDVRAFGED